MTGDDKIDLGVLELLASRLCHDLISPIGAVGNGLELIEEGDDPALTGDAIRLSQDSIRYAAVLLQFFRAAMGSAGARPAFRLGEARRLAADFLARGRHALDWPEDLPDGAAPAGAARLAMNMVLLLSETMPRGGTISLRLAPADSGVLLTVTARGVGAQLSTEMRAALLPDADPASLTPKTVQPYLTARQAAAIGGRLAVAAADNEVEIAARLPKG